MPEYLHPGVYVNEKSSGNQPIESASTSTACFIGATSRGRPFHPRFVTNWTQFERAFGGIDRDRDLPLAVRHFFLNGGVRAYIVRLLPPPPDDKPDEGTAIGTIPTSGAAINLRARGKGDWGNVRVRVRASRFSGDSAKQGKNDPPLLYDLLIEEKNADQLWEPAETHFDLGIKEDGERFYATILNRFSEYIQVTPDDKGAFPEEPITLAAASEDDEKGDPPRARITLAGGVDGAGEVLTAEGFNLAFKALKPVEDISVLVTPGVTLSTKTGALAALVAGEVESRKEFFYVMDGPGDPRNSRSAQSQLDEVSAQLKDFATKSSYIGLYFPWLEIPDPFSRVSGATRYTAPSGFVAGLFARTDNTRGVWKAPAGTEALILGAVDTAVKITDADQDNLNPVGINCIRKFPGAGIVSWGARTLATRSNPEYRYVPVRRFARFLAQSIQRGTQWVVFEPNDEPLWSAVRFNLNAFMQRLFREGALQGGKPEEAFFIKCDHENNTQDRIDVGEIHITVGFAPLKPAEFVIIDLVQMRKQ